MRKGLSTMRRVKMSRVVLRVTFLLPLGVVVCGAWAQTAHPGGSGSAYAPPLVFRRAQRLRRGDNAREGVGPGYGKGGLQPGQFSGVVTPRDNAIILSSGVEHARV